MGVVSMKQLLECGVHFGHQTRRWNPKMKPFIFTERNGIYIIDLQKTVKGLEKAYDFVREISKSGGSLLFVGTKRQAQDPIRDEALKAGQYYINQRWLGGLLTNFTTIRKRVARMRENEFVSAVNKLGGSAYLVGGCVRDQLMGRAASDRDYVVCCVCEQDFLTKFPAARKVGNSFPVFLQEIEGEKCEVAFARTERKTGRGYTGFAVSFDPDVTIEDDLFRRDTTMPTDSVSCTGIRSRWRNSATAEILSFSTEATAAAWSKRRWRSSI